MAIKEFRRSLKFPDEVEFKFHKSSPAIKEKFLRAVNPFNFSIRCLVVDKTLIHSEELKNNKKSFYGYVIKTVLQYSNNEIVDAKIKIDGSGDRTFRRSFLVYLRKNLNSRDRKIMKNCKLVDSRDNVLIQMADMVAGSVRRSYDETKNDKSKYKGIIAKHIKDEWKFK